MDPERPIEKLLRQAAQTRRAQAGSQELHPVDRRNLQSEVARKFAQAGPQKRSFLDWLTPLMPRLAWGAALVVGLGLAASLMLPRQNASQKEMFFAKNERALQSRVAGEPQAVAGAAPATTVAPAEAPAVASADLARAERDKDTMNLEQRRADSKKTPTLALNAPAAASQPVPSVGGTLTESKQKEELAKRMSEAAPTVTTTPPEGSAATLRYGLANRGQATTSSAVTLAGANVAASPPGQVNVQVMTNEFAYNSLAQQTSTSAVGLKLETAVLADQAKRQPAPIARASQQFVEIESLNKPAGAKPVLVSFELQQLGREVRIIDSDGSVYSGSFHSPAALMYLDSAPSQKVAVTRSLQTAQPESERKSALNDSSVAQANLNYAFKVSGTNQSLNQMVTFTGQLVAPTNNLTFTDKLGSANGNRLAPPELTPLPLGNSRISGKAIIGTNREVEVNAVPAH